MEEYLNEFHQVSVKAGTMVQLPVPLVIMPCTVRLTWTVARKASIIFGVEYKLNNSKDGRSKTVIRPNVEAPQNLELEFKNPGTLMFTWDNNVSFFTGRDVSYRITVLVPSDEYKKYRMASRIQAFIRMRCAKKRFEAKRRRQTNLTRSSDQVVFRFVEDEALQDKNKEPSISTATVPAAKSQAEILTNDLSFENMNSLPLEALQLKLAEVSVRVNIITFFD